MTIELDWKQLLDQMITSLKFLNRRVRNEAVTRGSELSEILKELCKYRIGTFQVKDLPRQEFRGAVQLYLIGLYDDSIHHAFFSVEMGLLVRLEVTLPPREKDALYEEINKKVGKPLSYTFGAILNKSREGGVGVIHGKKVNQEIESLIDKRNTYVHANNFLSGLIIAMKERTIPKIEKELKDLSDLLPKKEVEDFVNKNDCMKLLADVCNGIKHLKRDNERSGENPEFGVRVYSLHLGGKPILSIKWRIATRGGDLDAFQLATNCMDKWEEFIRVNL